MNVPQIVTDIKNNFSSLLKYGLSLLIEDIRKFPSFNPSAPYEEKNYYINRANGIGIFLLKTELSFYSEIYYQETLKLIKKYEQRNSKNFNKGIVYGNLGIVKISQGKYDEGIAYLMAGFKEDAPITGDHEQHFLRSPLYLQFEKKVHDYITARRQNYITGPVDSNYSSVFMNDLDTDNRLYFIAIVNNLVVNLEVFRSGNKNKYTEGRILSTLSDLCVFIEDAIKRKINPPPRTMLFDLLTNYALTSETWKNDIVTNWGLANSNNIADLETNLRRILAMPDRVRRFLTLGAIRNFTGHNFYVNGQFFFSHINDVENNIFHALFYLKDISKL